MTRIAFFLVLFSIVLGRPALAVVPEQGLWWNPAESGRGYGIEIQDNIIFITYYAYSPTGTSAYYTSSGRYNATTNSASLNFASFTNGQCFGCNYQRPVASSLGDVRATFTSSMKGRLDLPGGLSIPIQRQLFLGPEPRDSLYGIWHLTEGALGLYFGEMLWVQGPNESQSGGFQGKRLDSQRIFVGAPMANGDIALLLDSSTSYYSFYVFSWRLNGWVGRNWTYLKTSQLSGNGLAFFGSRVLGKTHAAGLSASDVMKHAAIDSARDNATETSAMTKANLQSATLKSSIDDPSVDGLQIDPDEARHMAETLLRSLMESQLE